MTVTTIRRARRCAIYTRKSTEDQWDTEFNSIESQRDICAAYITCQQHRDWSRLTESYDDAGFSGATMQRPALQRLLRDIERGEIDVVVIYKIDRLTRSLADFIRMVQVFEERGVKFVSVTQSFDTADSMGRLVLNILLTFAQFERELIADRVRDKIAAIKRRGMINGGKPPYGYDLVDGRLVVNETEASKVREIFRRYLETGSCCALSRQLKAEGLTGKVHVNRAGVARGGGSASNGMIYHMLKNPTYVGRVPHNGESFPGRHEAIVDRLTWESVQDLVADRKRFNPLEIQPRNLLKRLMRDSHGRRMVIRTSGVRKLRYYVSAGPCPPLGGTRRFRTRAERLEDLVLAALRATLADRETTRVALRDLGRRGDDLEDTCAKGKLAGDRMSTAGPSQLREMLRAMVVEGEISAFRLVLVLRSSEIARFLAWDGIGLFAGDRAAWSSTEPVLTVQRELDEVRFNRMVDMPVEPVAMAARGAPSPQLVKVLRDARGTQALVDENPDLDLLDLARLARCSPQRFCRLLRLNYLAPDIVAAIRAGAQPADFDRNALLRGTLPLDWNVQRQLLGFPARL